MSPAHKVNLSLLLFCLVIGVGTLGYTYLEGADPLTALYFTVITAASVGYSETVPLDAKGRIFTIFLIFAGMGTWTFVVVTLVAFLVEGQFQDILRKNRTRKRIRRMQDHFIICGLGHTGCAALREFLVLKHPCVAVERDEGAIQAVQDQHPNLPIIQGDATLDATLEAAGVERAKGLIASTSSDADNLFIVLTARSKNPRLQIASRATQSESHDKLIKAGADHVVMPNVTGGLRMASSLLRPQVVNFLDVMMRGPGEPLRVEQAEVPEGSPVIGMCLRDMAIPQKTGTLVLAVKRGGENYIFNPKPSHQFQSGDVLIAIGGTDQMQRLRAILTGGE